MLTFLLQRLKIPPTKPYRNLHRVSVAIPKCTCKVVHIQFCTVRKYWVFISITYFVNKKNMLLSADSAASPHRSCTTKLQGCPHGFLFMCSYSQLNDIHVEILLWNPLFFLQLICMYMNVVYLHSNISKCYYGNAELMDNMWAKKWSAIKMWRKKIGTFCPLALFGGWMVALWRRGILPWLKHILSNNGWDGSLAIRQKCLAPKFIAN